MESLYFLDCPVPGYRCSVRVAYPRRNAAIHKLCSQAASDAAGDSLPHRLGDSLCPNGHRRCQGIFHRRLFLSSARFAKFPAAAGSKFSMDDTVLRLSCLRSVLLWLLLLWNLVLRMIRSFRQVDKTAGNLQIPYLLWVTLAAFLNLGVWFLNR